MVFRSLVSRDIQLVRHGLLFVSGSSLRFVLRAQRNDGRGQCIRRYAPSEIDQVFAEPDRLPRCRRGVDIVNESLPVCKPDLQEPSQLADQLFVDGIKGAGIVPFFLFPVDIVVVILHRHVSQAEVLPRIRPGVMVIDEHLQERPHAGLIQILSDLGVQQVPENPFARRCAGFIYVLIACQHPADPQRVRFSALIHKNLRLHLSEVAQVRVVVWHLEFQRSGMIAFHRQLRTDQLVLLRQRAVQDVFNSICDACYFVHLQ